MAQLLATVLFLIWRSDFLKSFTSTYATFVTTFIYIFFCMSVHICNKIVHTLSPDYCVPVFFYDFKFQFSQTRACKSFLTFWMHRLWKFSVNISHCRNSSKAWSWPGDSVSHYSKQFPPPLCSRLLCLWLCLFAWWFIAECAPYL